MARFQSNRNRIAEQPFALASLLLQPAASTLHRWTVLTTMHTRVAHRVLHLRRAAPPDPFGTIDLVRDSASMPEVS